MVQKLHTFQMSKGKPQWITHLKTHFNCTVQAVLQIFNSLLFPQGIFSKTLYTFSFWMKKKECIFSVASSQSNLITFQISTYQPARVVFLKLQQPP